MKTFLITLTTILVFSIGTYAQNSDKNKKNTLKYGYGSTFHSNDMVGNFQYGEYTRFLGKRFALGLSGGYIDADNFSENNAEDYGFKALKGDANLFFLPFNGDRGNLKIGGGASYWDGEFRSKDSLEVDFMEVEEKNYGWNVVAEFEIYLGNTIALGSRAGYTQSQNGENYYFFGLNAGLKF